VMILKGSLYRMQLITFGKTLHSAQLGAVGLGREHEARTHCFAV